jgi:hypothetical protein
MGSKDATCRTMSGKTFTRSALKARGLSANVCTERPLIYRRWALCSRIVEYHFIQVRRVP